MFLNRACPVQAGPIPHWAARERPVAHPELRHVRTRGKAPGHNGVRERAFEPLNYERLYREQNDDALDLVRQAVFVSSASGRARVPSVTVLLAEWV